MASIRDKLRAKNAENAAERGNTSTNNSIFGDFIESAEKKDVIKSEEPANNKPEEKKADITEVQVEQVETPPETEINVTAEKEIEVPDVKPKKKSTNRKNSTNNTNRKNSNIGKEIKNDTVEEKKEVDTQQADISAKQNTIESFTGKLVTLTLLISPEIADYILIKPTMVGNTIRNVFMNIVLDEITIGKADETIAPAFRKGQHTEIRKSMQVPEDFRELIKTTAMKYRMKPTAFISYCLTRAYNNDKEYRGEE